MSAPPQQVRELVEHLFRRHAGQMLARLGRILGPAHFDLAEEAVQEAMLQALRQWPFHGVPHEPGAWLSQVAANKALDILRRRSVLRRKLPEIEGRLRAAAETRHAHDSDAPDGVDDDQLAMIFACCHPAIAEDAHVALTLNVVGGFSAAEVARAFLTPERTIAQRLVRAKRRIRDERIPLVVPGATQIAARLDSVLRVLYLLFNEGYCAYDGEDLVRFDLCNEAIRLGGLLAKRPDTALPKVHALLALMLFQGSRLAARQSDRGELILLTHQDRSLWDRRAVELGMYHLEHASEGDELTEYHLQAAIAAKHALAPTYEETDWRGMLDLYEQLIARAPSPVALLNRAVAVAMVRGPEEGLRALSMIENEGSLAAYYLHAATRAYLYFRLGRITEAAACYRNALRLSCTEPERRFLIRRISECLADGHLDSAEIFPPDGQSPVDLSAR
jgi:RNA polymerase sigma-70 factor (ECF subfamily)